MTKAAIAPLPSPAERGLPDIRSYAAGNCGIPYVFTFDSQRPGPHVMINALGHGNAVTGATIVKRLLDEQLRPRRGRLTLAFSNAAAYHRLDPTGNEPSSFIDEDFDCLWSDTVLDDVTRDSHELRRARRLRPVLGTVDLLLDFGQLDESRAPVIFSGPLDKGVDLAHRLNSSAVILADSGKEGRRMRDYADFRNPSSERNALLVKCGPHWQADAIIAARAIAFRFLLISGIVDTADFPVQISTGQASCSPLVCVTHTVIPQSNTFRFARNYRSFEVIAEPGSVIGWDGATPITTPYPDCVLVMPANGRFDPGATAVRFGQMKSLLGQSFSKRQ